ncbi:hypothetical protein [Thermocoleostomius sinensis]|uniref:Uncharacterized protein n=1 Tax=Thermocoleostomius sinensis A174 TaxID=2016057 RepID=A0A9E9C7H4_9CYAN|nr:hypothetical protein [Thermocoleostomius sinensis]WAL59238.1 hypothetical protein OXH18_18975 [Thermocoleostomius sinensis A174]
MENEKGKRRTDKFKEHDECRTRELYVYLVGTLARGNRDGRKEMEEAFGGRNFFEKLSDDKPGTIATGELAHHLAQLKQFFEKTRRTKPKPSDVGSPRILTSQEIQLAFLKLIELTPNEREQLGLTHSDEQLLMQQALLHIWGEQDQQDYEQILRFYNASIGLSFDSNEPLRSYTDEDLQETVQDIALKHLGYVESKQGEARQSHHADRNATIRKIIDEYRLVSLVKSEINRIILKVGVGQIRLPNIQGRQDYGRKYLPREFIKRLTKTVIDNELLNQEFPVFIKAVAIQECGPFPLTVSVQHHDQDEISNQNELGLDHASLNGDLLELDRYELDREEEEDYNHCADIATQYAYRVTIDFYVRIRRNSLSKKFPEVYEELKRDDEEPDFERIIFSLTSTGIGGSLSHITKVINHAVLNDISVDPPARTSRQAKGCVVNLRKDYFTIAHDVLIEHHFPRSNVSSPVWSHSLVMLCKNEVLGKVMDSSRWAGKLFHYTDMSFGDRVGWGDYCGFDGLLCGANAALQARLRAIRYTGIGAPDYVQALYNRIERTYLLETAQSYVTSYPFSSFAQESALHITFLRDLNRSLTDDDPYTFFKAYLKMAETFLNEGIYRVAWIYLEKVSNVLSRSTDWHDYFGKTKSNVSSFRVFSGSLIVSYTLCLAHYFMLVDSKAEAQEIAAHGASPFLPFKIAWEREDPLTWNRDETQLHQSLIRRSWQALEAAEKHLSIRLAKYFIINEESQGTFHPHYKLLAQIYFLRAKLFIFFPGDVPANSDFYTPPTDDVSSMQDRVSSAKESVIHANRLYLMEKARLYAASDGDSESYACYTAWQCWIYLMAAFVSGGVPIKTIGSFQQTKLSPSDCRRWGRQLRDDALLAYAETGRRCYLKIKEKSGVSRTLYEQRRVRYAEYGDVPIEVIPPLRETYKEGGSRVVGQGDNRLLELDMSVLALGRAQLGASSHQDAGSVVYLFGPNACYLFFARAMYRLCSDDLYEFSPSDCSSPPLAETVSDWDTKFEEAYRLFNYAWAIADDGGEIAEISAAGTISSLENPHHGFGIIRPFAVAGSETLEAFNEVAAIRDLYPLRISGIADLGRIFAAGCALLRLYTQTDALERQKRKAEIQWLLSDLQREEHCQHLNTFQVQNREAGLLNGQKRYNGYLTHYLNQCRQFLQHECLTAEQLERDEVNDRATLQIEKRQEIFKQLFDAFQFSA